MHYTFTHMKVIRMILLCALLLPLTGAWAQNPVVSLAGGPCTGSTLTVTSSGTPTQIVFSRNGSPVQTSTSTTYVASAAGTYTATVTTSTGSATTNSDVITAFTAPTVSIAAIPGNTICQGTNVNLNATGTFTGTTPSYQWKRNGAPVGVNSPTFSASNFATGDVMTCTMTSNAACASPVTATSNSITFTINATVTPSVSITVQPGTSICSGTPVTFSAVPVNGGTTPAYQWYLNGTQVPGATAGTYTSSTLSSGDAVYCKMVTSVPCPTVETVTSNTISMTVTPSVTPSVTVSANPGNSICSGTQVTFSASGVNTGVSPQYQWIKNGVQVNGATTTTYNSSSLANNDTISCTMTSSATCATTAQVSSNKVVMAVSTSATPQVTLAPATGSIISCRNDTVVFIASATSGGAAPLYTWIKNGVSLTQTSSNTYSITGLANNDTISCMLTSNLSCATSNTALSNKVIETVDTQITMTLSISANPGNNITAGQVVVFTATETNAGPSFNYQWYVNGTAANGSISPTYSTNTLANNDTVTCKVTTTEPCATAPVVTSNPIVMHVVSGVTTITHNNQNINIYPNPSTGSFTVNGTLTGGKDAIGMEITDMVGRVIYSTSAQVQNGVIKQNISLPSGTASGLYILKLTANNSTEILKLMISK